MGAVLKHVERCALRGPAQVQVVVTMIMAAVQKVAFHLIMQLTEYAPVEFAVMVVLEILAL